MSQNLTPRLYQLEIVELAKKSNVVAYLDTGAGKTFISVLLLRHRQEAAATAHAAALAAGTPPPPPWKAIFLAPQVALVEQQAAVISRHLSARVRKLVGADIESWAGDAYIANWRRALNDLDVLVATPQLVVDMLRHAVVPGLWIFDTIVFDEAHHCKGGHPYNRIMEYYKIPVPPTLTKPRIFGMSAAPAGAGAAKSYLLPKNLAILENNMQCQVVTVADRSMVEAVVPQPELEIEEYQCNNGIIEASKKLSELREGIEKVLARLDIAVALEQLRWNASLQGTVGLVGASDATYCTFDPGAPKFKISRLKDILRSVLHVLHQVGAYGAVQSTLHAFQWLAKGAPDPRQYTYSSSPFHFNSISTPAPTETTPTGAEEELGFADGYEDTTTTATNTNTTAQATLIATDIEYRLAELRLRATIESINWTEVEDLGTAAVISTGEVLKSFVSVFGEILVDQEVLYAYSVVDSAYTKSKSTAANSKGADRQSNSNNTDKNNNDLGTNGSSTHDGGSSVSLSIGNASIFIMQRIIDLIQPEDLEHSLDFLLTIPSDKNIAAVVASPAVNLLRFEFPLLSPKTAKLVEILQRYKPAQPEGMVNYWSGIVFAQQRTTVLALSSVLARLPRAQSWLKSSPFMAQGVALGGLSFMPDEQKAILDAFRAGKLNLIVSTSVAEEGIDVKSCQLVIRFDPAPTAQAFHQSRGRARAAGSQLIALVEHGNSIEHAAVHEMAAYQHKMREAALQNVADLAHADEIDPDDEDGNTDGIDLNSITESNREYVVAATGAKVDLHSAGSVLQHYISQLPADEFMLLRPAWRLDYLTAEGPSSSTAATKIIPPQLGGSYQVRATVRLPSSSPVQNITGQLAATKRTAKASAALEACRELHRLGAFERSPSPCWPSC